MKKWTLLLAGILGLAVSTFAQNYRYLTHDGITRQYFLRVPPGYDPAVPIPVIFNLHGYGSNAFQQWVYSGMDAVADTAGFMVVYPDGVANAWNSGFAAPYFQGVDDVGFISKLIDTLRNTYNIDMARIYSTGMSNGGFMSYRLACQLSDRIAAIASVTGVMSDSAKHYCNPLRPVPVMQIHGTADQTVPYNGAAFMTPVDTSVGWWVQHNGCATAPIIENLPDLDATDSTTVTRYEYFDCNDSASVVLLQIHNGGHTWAGSFDISNFGHTNRDIHASEEVWLFFKNKRLPEAFLPVSTEEKPTPVPATWKAWTDANGTIRFSHPTWSGMVHLSLYDFQGRLLSGQSLVTNAGETGHLQLSESVAGPVLLVVRQADGQAATFRLVNIR